MHKTIWVQIICFLAFGLVGCNSNAVYQQSKDIEQGKWVYDNPVTFNLDWQEDSLPINLMVDIRIAPEYNYANMWLFVDYVDPNNRIATDTVECPLAKPSGEWLGKTGLSGVVDNRILFKKNINLPVKGQYKIRFRHGMRKDTLNHVKSVGLFITPANI